MISVDIYVPFLNQTYDFQLDDDICVAVIIEEVAGMICQRERWPAPDNPQTLTLSSHYLGRTLHGWETLREVGIQTGSCLVLC